jgi:hypothetical protein
MENFPEIFEYMAKSGNLSNDMFHHSDVFPKGDGESRFSFFSQFFHFFLFVHIDKSFFTGQRPLVPLLLLGPPFFPIILLVSTTLLTGMTGISLHMQWPLTSRSHGSFLKENNCVFVTDQTPHPLYRQKLIFPQKIVKTAENNYNIDPRLKELIEWINAQPFSSASRQPCGTLALDEAVVGEICDLVPILSKHDFS